MCEGAERIQVGKSGGLWVSVCIRLRVTVIASSDRARLESNAQEAGVFGSKQSSVVRLKLVEEQPQILRLTTPKLKDVWGPVRSG